MADYGQNVSTKDSDEDNSTEEEYDTTDTEISSKEEYNDLKTWNNHRFFVWFFTCSIITLFLTC